MDTRKTILIVEDSEMEVILLRRAFTGAGVTEHLSFVSDGLEAINYLKGDDAYADRAAHPVPHLVLLDLKMPGVDGFEVLSWVRAQSGYRYLPVVVLTSSDEPTDIRRAYQLGANSYVTKRFGHADRNEMTALLHRYWIKVNVSPPIGAPTPPS